MPELKVFDPETASDAYFKSRHTYPRDPRPTSYGGFT